MAHLLKKVILLSKAIDMTGYKFNGCEVIEKESYKIHDRVAVRI